MNRSFFGLALLFIFILSGVAAPQQNDSEPEVFHIGAKTILIPSPAGFINGYPSIPLVVAHVRAFEGREGKTIAMHIPKEIAAKVHAGERVETLSAYAKIAVHNATVNMDVTGEMFLDFLRNTDRDFESLIDKELPKADADGRRALKDYLGRSTDLSLGRPVYLGSFDRRPDVGTYVMIASVMENGKRKLTSVGAMSYVVVGKQILYVHTYREFKTDADVDHLRAFTKKWIDEIIDANRS